MQEVFSNLRWQFGILGVTEKHVKPHLQSYQKLMIAIWEPLQRRRANNVRWWRNCSKYQFTILPPLLIFDINEQLADLVSSLEDIPKLIFVEHVTYFLGGVTAFIEERRHYVGYIHWREGERFFYFDGLHTDDFLTMPCGLVKCERMWTHIFQGEQGWLLTF